MDSRTSGTNGGHKLIAWWDEKKRQLFRPCLFFLRAPRYTCCHSGVQTTLGSCADSSDLPTRIGSRRVWFGVGPIGQIVREAKRLNRHLVVRRRGLLGNGEGPHSHGLRSRDHGLVLRAVSPEFLFLAVRGKTMSYRREGTGWLSEIPHSSSQIRNRDYRPRRGRLLMRIATLGRHGE